MHERLGIFEELQARRAQYARRAYRAPVLTPAQRQPVPQKVYSKTAAFKRALRAVCNAWSVSEYELLGPHRTVRISHPRYALCRLGRERLGWSMPRIALEIGGKHHTSVLHGHRRANELHRHHRDWRNRYDAALIELRGGVC